ncbi:hypothetical protein TCARB_1289 [Thermofilum adornatum 1505]|uniref:Uncharacterized protein n=1 Tax=Thermofilum adornatum 1505 TaxID=697581 RepID=A0A3G1A853_9CREN|nr:hypothetical protein TCARB_1289 [Thermofilum adornatum 1505]
MLCFEMLRKAVAVRLAIIFFVLLRGVVAEIGKIYLPLMHY